jgi:glycosyltransferase XagB
MTKNTFDIGNNLGASPSAEVHRLPVLGSLLSHEQTALVARQLPPELAFLTAEGFSPEPLLESLVAVPKAVSPVDQLFNEGKLTEEVYYRALASHLGCQYYCGNPPLAPTIDAAKGLRCGVALIEPRDAGPRMVIAPRAQLVSRLIEATLSGTIRSGSFALASPQRFASLVRAYCGADLLDVALGRLPTSLTTRDGMTSLQIAALGAVAILALALSIADLAALAAVSSTILWLIYLGLGHASIDGRGCEQTRN